MGKITVNKAMLHSKPVAVVKLVATGVLLYLFIRRTDFGAVIAALSRLSLRLIIGLALLNIFGVLVAAYKWQMLLPSADFWRVIVACFASYYVALLLPGQVAQEAAKAYYLSLGQSPRVHLIAASVLVDKIISIIGLLIVGVTGVALSETPLPPSLIWLFFVSGAVAILCLFSLRIARVYSCLCHFLAHLENLIPRQKRLLQGCSRLFEAWHLYTRNPSLLAGNIAMAVLYQLVGVVMFYLLARGLQVPIGLFDWSWIVGVLTLALFLPLTIGGLGIREGTLIGVLAMLGYGSDTAIAVSVAAFSFVLMLALIGAILSVTSKPQRKGTL